MAFSKIFGSLNLSGNKPDSSNFRPVAITRDLDRIIIKHDGKPFEISREKNNDAVIPAMYAKTSRPCPPFCIQPMVIAEGVETIGELEFLDYLVQKSDGDDALAIIDSRTTDWVLVSTIPGTTNVPWISLSREVGVTAAKMISVLTKRFGVKVTNEDTVEELFNTDKLSEVLDFSEAKTLVLYCNGPWCEQSPINIRSLLHLGYPAEKIKYFRDGMQGWVGLGFPTVP
ncbi:MAG TPA: rhodanese-like domain-containing protein [Leucothrix mucor]|nr:rhodanese-like domain-containing protein [Leucothrix mucor]